MRDLYGGRVFLFDNGIIFEWLVVELVVLERFKRIINCCLLIISLLIVIGEWNVGNCWCRWFGFYIIDDVRLLLFD